MDTCSVFLLTIILLNLVIWSTLLTNIYEQICTDKHLLKEHGIK